MERSAARRALGDRPLLVGALLVLFVALHAPCLGWGFFADDWGQRLVLEHPEEAGSMRPWNLYDFGDPETVRAAYAEDAILPWWTDPGWKARFFRPVSSCVLWGEHALFGRFAPAHHAAGLAWHALYLFLAWRLYRAAGLTGAVALLALSVLALEDGASMTVGWIANRNSVVEGVCTAGALLCAVHGRRAGGGAWIAGALVLGLLAAGSKESGFAALLGSAFLLGTSPARPARLGALAAVVATAGYFAFLFLAGYGVRCQFYPTPWGEPLRWARHSMSMLSAGPVATLGPFPVDALLLVPVACSWAMVALSVAILAVLARPWWQALRSMPLGLAFAAFALVSLVPQASAPPSDRLLYVPALGLAPISALMLADLRAGSAGRWGKRLGLALLVSALPVSALSLVGRSEMLRGVANDLGRVYLEAELERAPAERRDVFLLQSPSVLASLSPLAAWRFYTGDRNTRFHALQFGRRGLAWTRTDERTFELESLDEPFLDTLFEQVFLSSTPQPGARYSTPVFDAEIVGPRQLRFRCARALDSASFVWLTWSEGRWRRILPPAVGQTLRVEPGVPLRPFLP